MRLPMSSCKRKRTSRPTCGPIFQGAVRVALEVVFEEELREMVGARRWERLGQRLDRRNGTYLRHIMTSMGTVGIAVPRAREGGSAGSAVLGRYKRRAPDVDDAIVSAYVEGASTRDVGRITGALMGEGVWPVCSKPCEQDARREGRGVAECAHRRPDPVSLPRRHVSRCALGTCR